jgi:hypothetical protein
MPARRVWWHLVPILVGGMLAAYLVTAGGAMAPVSLPASVVPVHHPPGPTTAVSSHTPKPVRLIVPGIDVDTTLQPLGLLADGSLASPRAWGVAGWYANGVRPGDTGPAVIVGHVDSRAGPAVFHRLREVRPGNPVLVTRQDGRTLLFLVDDVREYPKTQFPRAAVYGPAPLPELRLVTCTGDFDWKARSYLDNLVVSAHLVA